MSIRKVSSIKSDLSTHSPTHDYLLVVHGNYVSCLAAFPRYYRLFHKIQRRHVTMTTPT